MAKLAKQSLPKPEVRSSNSVILSTFNVEKTKINKKRPGMFVSKNLKELLYIF